LAYGIKEALAGYQYKEDSQKTVSSGVNLLRGVAGGFNIFTRWGRSISVTRHKIFLNWLICPKQNMSVKTIDNFL